MPFAREVRRVAVAVVPDDGREVGYFTFRPQPDGTMDEDRARPRRPPDGRPPAQPVAAARVRRDPARGARGRPALHAVAAGNPQDQRLVALAQVRQLVVVRDESRQGHRAAAHRTGPGHLVNTQGGNITIASFGANGPKGDDGQSGADGQNGADGAITNVPETTTDTSGHTITTYVQVQGPGSDGGDGGDGGDGENGYDGRNGGNITVYYTAAAAPYLKMIVARSVPGVGGPGGSGGPGGNGGAGGNGNPLGRRGRNGRDGNSGASGSDGSPEAVRFVAQ